MSARPALLLVAPILPAQSGNGLAMRAGVFLEALAADFAVTLLVIPVAGAAERPMTRFVAERTRRVAILSLEGRIDPLWTRISRIADPAARAAAFESYPRPAMCRYATAPCVVAAAEAVGGERFDAIHVLRGYLTPYIEPLLDTIGAGGKPSASLDLDDDDAATHLRMGAAAQNVGAVGDARRLKAEAAKYGRLETRSLPRYRLLLACTEGHARRLREAHPAVRAAVVPNTVAMPPIAPREHRPRERILFVGNLSYRPNVDGIVRFVDDILPRLLQGANTGVLLRIAGSAPVAKVAALVRPGVEIVADPPDLRPSYAWADLAVVPLAAGGGTRIKLIEAFAHGVPVVSTSIGAEGVDARHGVHLLVADSAAAFADACMRLLADHELAGRLASAARSLVEIRYSHAHGTAAIRSAFEGVLAGVPAARR